MQGRLSRVEEILGYQFNNKELAASAVTHPSAVEGLGPSASYERLEFLGDAILGAAVSKALYERFDEMDEGELTRLKISLISGSMLSQVAEDLGLAPLILMGESEKGTKARGLRHALEDVYEALVAALFLDGGLEICEAFIERTLLVRLDPALASRPLSPKSLLQQLTQRDLHCAPEYRLVGSHGPAHSPVFITAVFVKGEESGRGEGHSKKESESAAAEQALLNLGFLPAMDELAGTDDLEEIPEEPAGTAEPEEPSGSTADDPPPHQEDVPPCI